LSDTTVVIISQFVGKPMYPDPPTREGEYSFKSTHEQWRRLTVDGKYTLRVQRKGRKQID